MSGIELKLISESETGRATFLVPLGKTVIGRGSVLGVSDKRVSRNHGVVEIEDGILKIMSTHTNPTFYRAKGTTKLLPLARDVWQSLQHGDRIALTPDQHVFEVIIEDRPLNKESLDTSLGESPVKQSPDKQQKQTEGNEENVPQENNQAKVDSTVPESEESKSDADKTPQEETKRAAEDAKEEDNDGADASSPADQPPHSTATTVTLPGQKEIALPTQKERKLPDWMANLDTRPPSKVDVKTTPAKAAKGRRQPKATASTAKTPQTATKVRRAAKPVVSEEGSDDDDYEPAVKKTPSRGHGRSKAAGRSKGGLRSAKRRRLPSADDDDEEGANEDEVEANSDEEKPVGRRDEDEEDGARKWGHGKTRNQASVKRRAKQAMDYSEDFVHSDVEEEEIEEEVMVSKEDQESDWEPESHSPRFARSPSKGRRGPTRTRSSGRKRSGRRRGNSRRSSDDDDDSDFSEQEVYIPRPTKRSGRSISSSQETSQDVFKPRKRTKKTDNGNENRLMCRYGKKCYRKNPQHIKEYSHPGDSDYESPNASDENNDDSGSEPEEELEECPDGTDCHRKNKSHLKQYKHTKIVKRPKRQAAIRRKAAPAVAESTSLGQDNDYDESFIDDGTQNSPAGSGGNSSPVEEDADK